MLLVPFDGFTPLSVFSLVTCQLYCKAKHHWEDTVYKTPRTWGTFLFSKLWQDLTQCNAGRFRNSSITRSCLSTLADCTGASYIKKGRGDVLRLNSYVRTALPARLLWAPVCQYKPKKTAAFEHGVILLLCMDQQSSFPAQHLYCHYAFSKRSHAHTSLYSILLASLPQHL